MMQRAAGSLLSHSYTMLKVVFLLSLSCVTFSLKMFGQDATIEEIVKRYGYPLESHRVVTSDGYILTYHRVPHGNSNCPNPRIKRRPILISNGIFMCSLFFLMRENMLPYRLADQGFDVWLANYRGNYYSRSHVSWDPVRDHQFFWNFTLHQLGFNDLSAGIDYIVETTGFDRLIYVGYSMGTTMFWVMAATRPVTLAKVAFMVGVAPVAVTTHTVGVRNKIMYRILYEQLESFKLMGHLEVLPLKVVTRQVITSFCRQYKGNCMKMISTQVHSEGLSMDDLVQLMKVPPSGISTYVLMHLMQVGKARRFQQFDYGLRGNIKRYHTIKPPQYDLKSVRRPTYLVYSSKDDIAAIEDVTWLRRQLGKEPRRILKHLDYRHLDYHLNQKKASIFSKYLTRFLVNAAHVLKDMERKRYYEHFVH